MPRKPYPKETRKKGVRAGKRSQFIDYDCAEQRALKGRLKAEGLEIKRVDGDGNCMFRSIADQLCSDPDAHALYRSQILRYMEVSTVYLEQTTSEYSFS
jgi:hypothetical protein